MFVQVIQGRAKDAAGLRKQFDKWNSELKPGAEGFLGSTGGVTDDGEFIMCARFQSEQAARLNSDRTEQGQWWSETESYLDGPATFHDCTKAQEFMRGGADDAGFVQIIQGRAKDAKRLQELSDEFDKELASLRPDIIGGYHAEHGDGSFTDVNYFTSEAEARKGESQDYPDDVKARFDEWGSLIEGIKFIDLRDPWMMSR